MKLTKAAHQRVTSNIDIAQSEAARAHRTRPKTVYEELLSSAYYALCMVALKPYRGERYSKIARIACRRQISKDRARWNRNHIGKYSLTREEVDEVADVPDILDRLVDTENLVRMTIALTSLKKNPKIIMRRILEGATPTEIAAELQLTCSTVSEHVRRVKARLRKKLNV
jgi:RNA polymerase sigma factor (sigma-70 family)